MEAVSVAVIMMMILMMMIMMEIYCNGDGRSLCRRNVVVVLSERWGRGEREVVLSPCRKA